MPAISAGDLALLRTHPHRTKLYLIVHQPATLFTARVQAAPDDATATLSYQNGSAAGVNLLSGMTVLIGSTPGGHERRILRLRDDHVTAASGTLPIAESSDLHGPGPNAVQVNDYITVLEEWRIWPVYPRMVESGGTITWYKDYDDAWPGAAASLPPVAIAGPPPVAFLDGDPVSVNYDGSDSYAVYPGATIAGHSWIFDNGNPSTSTAQTPGAVNYVTASGMAGHRVTYTVTDSNGITQVTYRHAFILERSGANAPITDFALESLRGSFDSGGWTASIRVYGPAASATNIRPGSMVMLFAEDWYGGTAQSIGPFPAAQAPRNNLVFVGWIVDGTIRQDADTGDVLFEAENATALMRRMEMYSVSCKDSASPSEWYQVRDLTVNRALRHYWGWHSTLYLTCDVFEAGNWKSTAGTAGDERIKAQDFAEGDLYSVADQFLQNAIIGRVLGDRTSRIRPEMDFQVQANAGTQIFAATAQDWRTEIEIPEPHEAEAKQVDLSGTNWDGAAGLPFFSRAPGLAAKYRGTGYRNERFAVHSQAQLNEVSGDILASLNNPYPALRFPCAGNWRVFDICPQEYFTLAQVTDRRTFTDPDDKFIPREVAIEHDAEHSSMTVDVVACYKTDGEDGVTIAYPNTPPTGGGSGSPPAIAGDPGGDEIYLCTEDGLYRGTNIINDLSAAAVWENISPNTAGVETLWNFMIDPFDRNIAYVVASANGGSNTALWRTTNLRDSTPAWETLLTGDDLAAAGVTEQTLYRIHGALTQQGYLFVYGSTSVAAGQDMVIGYSYDRGDTWNWVNLTTAIGGGFELKCWSGYHGLDVSDWDATHVLVGVSEWEPVSADWYPAIYHSTDGGATWSLLHRFGTSTWPVHVIHLPQHGNPNDRIVLAATQSSGGACASDIWQSTDGGATFSSIQPSIGPGYTTYCTHLEADVYNARNYMFFSDVNPSTRNYLFLSTDAGASWSGVATALPNIQTINYGTGGHYPGSNIYYYADDSFVSTVSMLWVTVDAGVTWIDRTSNFWSIAQGGNQALRRIMPLVPVRTWGG